MTALIHIYSGPGPMYGRGAPMMYGRPGGGMYGPPGMAYGRRGGGMGMGAPLLGGLAGGMLLGGALGGMDGGAHISCQGPPLFADHATRRIRRWLLDPFIFSCTQPTCIAM